MLFTSETLTYKRGRCLLLLFFLINYKIDNTGSAIALTSTLQERQNTCKNVAEGHFFQLSPPHTGLIIREMMEEKTSAVTSQKRRNGLNRFKRRAELRPHTSHFSLLRVGFICCFFSTNRLFSQLAWRRSVTTFPSLRLALLALYVPGLGQVGYESHDHPHVHPCPHGDGEGGHEQRSSGAYSCTGEVSLGVGLACLSKQSREWSEAACYSSATSVRVGVKPHLREKARKCSP